MGLYNKLLDDSDLSFPTVQGWKEYKFILTQKKLIKAIKFHLLVIISNAVGLFKYVVPEQETFVKVGFFFGRCVKKKWSPIRSRAK